jgi:hypothetical protein
VALSSGKIFEPILAHALAVSDVLCTKLGTGRNPEPAIMAYQRGI